MAAQDISREELFALVWSKPTTEVAQDLGITDVAVAKLCARLQVPKPRRGYWAKVAAGRKPRQSPLKDFQEHSRQARNTKMRPSLRTIRLSPIQQVFVERALDELAEHGVAIGATRIANHQAREIDPDVAAQLLLLIQHGYLGWIRRGEIDVTLTPGARRSLAGLIDKLLPLAKPQVVVLNLESQSRYSVSSTPVLVLRLTDQLQLRIAQLRNIVREQQLSHVVTPLAAQDHAWSAHMVYSPDSYATADTKLCISHEELWVDCTITMNHFHGDQRETYNTERVALRSIIPIDLMPDREVDIPPSVDRMRIKPYWKRLRALIEADRVHAMLDSSFWALERDVPDDKLAVMDRIWFGPERPLLGARRAWEGMADELERWSEELEAERADLCRSILRIALGDIIVQARNGELTRLQVTSTSMLITDDRTTLIVEGVRFRRDGTVGKRLDRIWIDCGRGSDR